MCLMVAVQVAQMVMTQSASAAENRSRLCRTSFWKVSVSPAAAAGMPQQAMSAGMMIPNP